MVDLQLDIRPLFPQSVVKVNSDLIPNEFHGNRYQVTDAKFKTCEIIDTLGELSAKAQQLKKPITTHQKLRQFEDQTIYLMGDAEAKPRGIAIGLLKIGQKDLTCYDEQGRQFNVKSPCVLDFYIHDSHQRLGLGKILFDKMLAEEKLRAVKLSLDRPSENMINFMKKHYGLEKIISHPNHYVFFDGYFDKRNVENHNCNNEPIRIAYKAKNVRNFNYNNLPQVFVSSFKAQPDQSMAEIMENLCTLKR